jgi:hypothetical protein
MKNARDGPARLHLRVCTYAGPTSEWLEERDVDRSLLAGRRPGFIDAAIRRVDERLVGMQNG